MESARWRRYPSGRGEWCFADELPQSFVEKLKKGPMEVAGRRSSPERDARRLRG